MGLNLNFNNAGGRRAQAEKNFRLSEAPGTGPELQAPRLLSSEYHNSHWKKKGEGRYNPLKYRHLSLCFSLGFFRTQLEGAGLGPVGPTLAIRCFATLKRPSLVITSHHQSLSGSAI